MLKVQDLVSWMEQLAPPGLAEDWDNVGLLIGSTASPVESIMTCLTLTPDVAEEAAREGVSLVITHHPVLFRPVQRLTDRTAEGGMLLQLIRQNTAVYSPHTSYDSAMNGINQQLSEQLGIAEPRPLRLPHPADEHLLPAGGGRWGQLVAACSLEELVERVKQALKMPQIQYVGDPAMRVERLAVACGAAAEFLADAARESCEVLLTGEARFHDCLEARTRGMGLILPGHYMTERPAMEILAQRLAREFPKLRVWASRSEADPVRFA